MARQTVSSLNPAGLAQAVEAMGKADFAPLLAQWLRSLIPYSFTVVFGYSGAAKPIDIYDDFPKDRRRVFVEDYMEGPYLLDPFYHCAIAPIDEGLHRLRELAPDRFYQGEYFRSYYTRTEIAEEIGFFVHLAGECAIVWSLMRQEKPFTPAELRLLRQIAALVCSLIRRNWSGLADQFKARNLDARAKPKLDRLTPREREIVDYILKGHSAEATAEALSISSGTVRIHRRNIYAKLGISSQRELFARFLAEIGS